MNAENDFYAGSVGLSAIVNCMMRNNIPLSFNGVRRREYRFTKRNMTSILIILLRVLNM